jgi:hypothetical protein
MRILPLGQMFRPKTSHVYPPFKNGRYMEEYMYEYIQQHPIDTDFVYLPVFWSNIQNHPGFKKQKPSLQALLDEAIQKEKASIYIVIVQHDDGPLLKLPFNTLVFGACSGDIPLPLIYEDITHRLEQTPRTEKTELASFVGTITTHPIRMEMMNVLEDTPGIQSSSRMGWSEKVPEEHAQRFIDSTLSSRFCLAPRGYGRSSFRLYEVMQLGSIPVYIYDHKWCPFEDEIDWSEFSVLIDVKDIQNIDNILSSYSTEKIKQMQNNLYNYWINNFTMESICKRIIDKKISKI